MGIEADVGVAAGLGGGRLLAAMFVVLVWMSVLLAGGVAGQGEADGRDGHGGLLKSRCSSGARVVDAFDCLPP